MRTVQIFEKGERVGIEMLIEAVALEGGEVKYKLKDPRSQKDYPYIFGDDELFPLTPEQLGDSRCRQEG